MLPNGSDPRTARFSPPKIPPGCTISAVDVEYLKVRGVSRTTAEAAGWYTATKPSHVPAVFSARQKKNVPALIAPHLSPAGVVGWQKRDHHPGKDRKGRVMKWVSPPGERAATVMSVHPWTLEEATSGTEPLWLPEGLTRGHALAVLGIPALTYAGCWSWQIAGEALACFDSVNLAGRLVLDVPDADYRTNENVQKALAKRVAFLEGRGARVLVVSVPEVDGDPNAGLDDYIAAGGDPLELAKTARPYEPADVGRERLSRDERLRRLVAAKRREVEDLPARKVAECNAVKLARWLLEDPAPAHGKLTTRGVRVHPSYSQMAEGIRVGSLQTVSKALDRLEDAGFLVRERGERKEGRAASYVLQDPSGGGVAQGVDKGEQRAARKEGQEHKSNAPVDETPLIQRESHASVHSTPVGGAGEKFPPLRSSKLVHTYGMREGRRVVIHSDYFKRYGPKREEIIRHVLGAGCVRTCELRDKFGARGTGPARFFRTWIELIVKDGVFRGDLESVEMAPGWREALEGVRERTDEPKDNRLQTAKFKDRRLAYRNRDRTPADPTPQLMGKERVRKITARMREREIRPALAFVKKTLEPLPWMRLGLLAALWREEGGDAFYLRLAMRRLGCRWRRHTDHPDEVFVYPPDEWPGDPEGPAEVVPMRPQEAHAGPRRTAPKVEGVHVHGPECSCWICEDEPDKASDRIGASA
ncbi:MAG TPA: hypothetical protein VGR18_10580 [Rubrobacter sp.]|nr:hypothetical protein [Rubrobacter sp.]